MKTAYHFFLKYAGYSYDPKTQTPMQGRIQSAQRMAEWEELFMQASRVADVGIEWSDDLDGWADWKCDKRAGYVEGPAPESIERACIWHRDESGTVHYLASLHGIQDADANYRRVVRAELADECAEELRAIIERAE